MTGAHRQPAGTSAERPSRSGARRIPKDEEVVGAIMRVLAKHPSVDTQHAFASLVHGELRRINGEYAVSGERVRRLAVRSGFAELAITLRGGADGGDLKECPVCGGAPSRVRNRTLTGRTTTLAWRCKRCGFSSTARDPSEPARYVFRAKD